MQEDSVLSFRGGSCILVTSVRGNVFFCQPHFIPSGHTPPQTIAEAIAGNNSIDSWGLFISFLLFGRKQRPRNKIGDPECFSSLLGSQGQPCIYPCHPGFQSHLSIVIIILWFVNQLSSGFQLFSFLGADRWLVLLNATLALKTALF